MTTFLKKCEEKKTKGAYIQGREYIESSATM